MTLVRVEGVADINFVRTGPRGGAPIIFLHPVGLDLTWWSAQFEALGHDHDIAAFDMPSHGLSGQLDGQPSFELMAACVEGVLARMDTGPAHLVGVSVGGMIAQKVALQRPDLVRSLLLVATLCTFPQEVRHALRERGRVARTEGMAKIAELSNARWFPPAFRDGRPDMLDRATKSLLLQDPAFHGAMWEMISALDLEAQLPAIKCPVLVVVGSDDVNAPLAAGEKIARQIPGTSLKILAGVGHFPPFEAPQPFNDLLRHFLTEVDAAVKQEKS